MSVPVPQVAAEMTVSQRLGDLSEITQPVLQWQDLKWGQWDATAQILNLWASGNRETILLHGSQKHVGATKLQRRSGGGDHFLHTQEGLHPETR